jgi:hypothetical protein
MLVRLVLTSLALGVSPAFAADPATAKLGAFEVTADLRDEYLQGQPLLVHLDVANVGKESRNFPDLVNRPWLVKFDVDRGGKLESRYTTPPAVDPDKNWRLAPGVERDVLLEIPSTGVLPAGTYALTVRVAGPEGEISIGPRSFTLAAPKPIAGDGPFQPGTASRFGHMTVWTHDGKEDGLYLHVSTADDLRRTEANYALAASSTDAPHLSVAVPTQAWSRHVFWQQDERTIAIQGLVGPGKPGPVARLTVPWPRARIAGQGVTALDGALQLPIWVPAPKGTAGDLKIMTVKDGRNPTFRTVAPFSAAPDGVTGTVDAAGNVRFLVRQGSTVDIYISDAAAAGDLPAKGLRIATPEKHTPALARFAEHTGADEGGLAVFIVDRVAGEVPSVSARWHALSGEKSGEIGPFPVPADFVVLDAVPVGAKSLALLLADSQGKRHFSVDGAKPTPIPGISVGLVQDKLGGTWVETLGGAPVSYVPVAPPPAR